MANDKTVLKPICCTHRGIKESFISQLSVMT